MAAPVKCLDRSTEEQTPSLHSTGNSYPRDHFENSPIRKLQCIFFNSGRNAESSRKEGPQAASMETPSRNSGENTEPTSPQVGCTGQIDKNQHSHNEVIPDPRPQRSASKPSIARMILKLMFSGHRSLKKVGKRFKPVQNHGESQEKEHEEGGHVNPLGINSLTVMNPDSRAAQAGNESKLWKRRFGGRQLRQLQIERASPLDLTAREPIAPTFSMIAREPVTI